MEQLGNKSFALLALARPMIGYAGALNSAIGRAITQPVAKLRGQGDLLAVRRVLIATGQITLVATMARVRLFALFAPIVNTTLVSTQDAPTRSLR